MALETLVFGDMRRGVFSSTSMAFSLLIGVTSTEDTLAQQQPQTANSYQLEEIGVTATKRPPRCKKRPSA